MAELRKRHIIGAKIRVFCVRHERCPVAMVEGGDTESGGRDVMELETAYFVSHPLPLLNGSQSTNTSRTENIDEEPNPETSFEQAILMGLPHVVVHRMDSLSPMMPPRPVWYDEGGVPHSQGTSHTPLTTLSEAPTESTAESNGDTRLMATDRQSGPQTSSLQPSRDSNMDQPTQEEVTHFLQDRQAEIIIFLEGTCEVTGMALQARHSYRTEDIAFHQTFAPCVFPAGADASSRKKWWKPFSRSKAKADQDLKQGKGEVYNFNNNSALEIDFSQFHDMVPAAYDSMSCPYIPSSSLRNR